MSIFDRGSLEASSLADLHAIASELSIDGYRRLRKDDLIAAILDRQSSDAGAAEPVEAEDVSGGPEEGGPEEEQDEAQAPSGRRRRGRRGGRGRGGRAPP